MRDGLAGVFRCIAQTVGDAFAELRCPLRLTNVIDYYSKKTKVERHVINKRGCESAGRGATIETDFGCSFLPSLIGTNQLAGLTIIRAPHGERRFAQGSSERVSWLR
jgi:hypothetical protein